MRSFLFSLFVVLPLLGQAQAFTKQQIRTIEKALKEEMKYASVPGLAVSIIKDGKLAYQRSFGTANVQTGIPVTDSTVFQIASVTKMFTSVALQMVLEQKGMPLSTPVGTVVKGLPAPMAAITFAQLLSHSSGIVDSWPLKTDCPDNLAAYFALPGEAALWDKPGAVFSYSNNGFALAGLALATLNQTTYAAALESLLFKPLEMNRSTCNIYDVAHTSFAAGHQIGKNGKATPALMEVSKKTLPAGGVFSTVEDLTKFSLALLNRGMVNGKQVISQAIADTLLSKRAAVFSVPSSSFSYINFPEGAYGYGTVNFRYGPLTFVGHPGEMVYQNALVLMEPQQKFGVVMLSNRGSYLLTDSFKKIVEVALGVKEPVRDFAAGPAASYQPFTGRYVVPDVSGQKKQWSEIELKDGHLVMRFEDKREFALRQTGPAEFTFQDPAFLFPSAIAFYKDKSGNYKYLNYLLRTRLREQ